MVLTLMEEWMAPLAARLDSFVRWFFNSSPSADIEVPSSIVREAGAMPFVAGHAAKSDGSTMIARSCP